MSKRKRQEKSFGPELDPDSDEDLELYVNQQYQKKKDKIEWTSEERRRLMDVMGLLDSGRNYWSHMTKHVKTKSKKEVQKYVCFLSLLDSGKPFRFFRNKSAIDAWLELSKELSKGHEGTASACLPQLFTVAAQEPIAPDGIPDSEKPNYALIYQYISALLRGAELPDMTPKDASILCELYDGLIAKLVDSNTSLQKEFMRDCFGAHEDFTIRRDSKEQTDVKNSGKETPGTVADESKPGPSSSSLENDSNIKETVTSTMRADSECQPGPSTAGNEIDADDEASEGAGVANTNKDTKNGGPSKDCENDLSDEENEEPTKVRFPSINPFNIPLELLEFLSKGYK